MISTNTIEFAIWRYIIIVICYCCYYYCCIARYGRTMAELGEIKRSQYFNKRYNTYVYQFSAAPNVNNKLNSPILHQNIIILSDTYSYKHIINYIVGVLHGVPREIFFFVFIFALACCPYNKFCGSYHRRGDA